MDVSPDIERRFAEHRPAVARLCRRLVRDAAQAEELAQEALLVGWTRLPTWDDERRLRPWLFGIARNLCLNAVRKKGELLTEDGIVEPGRAAATALARLRSEERAALLAEASSSVLDAAEKEALHLRYIESLPLEGIEAVLGLPPGAARTVLQRVKRKLRREIRGRLEAMGEGSSFLRPSEASD